jgi:hypothetical protein
MSRCTQKASPFIGGAFCVYKASATASCLRRAFAHSGKYQTLLGAAARQPPMALHQEGGVAMLTPKQETFACKIVEGMTQADAYRAAYSTAKMSDKTIWENASRLMADSKVQARVAELRAQIASKSIMTAQERLIWLSEIIRSEEESTDTKLKASDQMNKMQAAYITKIDGNFNVAKLEDLI